MAVAYEKDHPDVDVVYTMIPMTNGEYQTKLMATLGTPDVPDVVALEAAFVKQYVESDFLADLSDLMPSAEELKMFPFVYETAPPMALSRAFPIRRPPVACSIAAAWPRNTLAPMIPLKSRQILSDMDKYIAAAEVVKTKSGGNTFMVASNGDFMNLFYANRAQAVGCGWHTDRRPDG